MHLRNLQALAAPRVHRLSMSAPLGPGRKARGTRHEARGTRTRIVGRHVTAGTCTSRSAPYLVQSGPYSSLTWRGGTKARGPLPAPCQCSNWGLRQGAHSEVQDVHLWLPGPVLQWQLPGGCMWQVKVHRDHFRHQRCMTTLYCTTVLFTRQLSAHTVLSTLHSTCDGSYE